MALPDNMQDVPRLLDLLGQLRENIDAVYAVLDGTYGAEAKQDGGLASQQILDVETLAVEVASGLEAEVERLEGMRERLQRLVERF